MPVVIMYPAQTSSIMRSKPVNKNRVGSQHPQWMRTLEEKYQRLHKKINESTQMMNLKFSSHSRSFHDIRLSHATRFRDPNIAKANIKPSNNKCHTPVSLTAANNNKNLNKGKPTVDQNGNCLQSVENNSNGVETEQILNKLNMNEPAEHGNEQEAVLETADKHSDVSSESSYDYKSEEGNLDVINSSDIRNRVVINSPSGDDMKIIDYETELGKHDNVIDVNQEKRDLKTALSRTSRKTAKSCPAQIQARSNIRHKSATQSNILRSRSAHRSADMFNKMSKEAHHAITETVKEMNASRSQTCLASDAAVNGVAFYPSKHRKSVRTWVQSKKGSNKRIDGYDVARVLQNASHKMQHLIDCNADLLRQRSQETFSSANQSCRSSHGSGEDLAKKSSSKLPEIQNDFPKDKFTSKSQFFRLPGIGKYDVPVGHDALFEITPPGFDSRYKDLEPVEERESETPPPDIRKRAIDKCSEWLSKYSQR